VEQAQMQLVDKLSAGGIDRAARSLSLLRSTVLPERNWGELPARE
jgi:hypothetical protein